MLDLRNDSKIRCLMLTSGQLHSGYRQLLITTQKQTNKKQEVENTVPLERGRIQAVNDDDHEANITDEDQKISVIKKALYESL